MRYIAFGMAITTGTLLLAICMRIAIDLDLIAKQMVVANCLAEATHGVLCPAAKP